MPSKSEVQSGQWSHCISEVKSLTRCRGGLGWSQSCPNEICCRNSETGVRLSLRKSRFPVNYHSTTAPYAFIYYAGGWALSPLQATQFCWDTVSPYHERKGRVTSFTAVVRFGPVNTLAVMDDWSMSCVYGVLFRQPDEVRSQQELTSRLLSNKRLEFYVTSGLLQITAQSDSLGSKGSNWLIRRVPLEAKGQWP